MRHSEPDSWVRIDDVVQAIVDARRAGGGDLSWKDGCLAVAHRVMLLERRTLTECDDKPCEEGT